MDTDLASVCIFFGVAPARRVWKGVSSERLEDKLNLFLLVLPPLAALWKGVRRRFYTTPSRDEVGFLLPSNLL